MSIVVEKKSLDAKTLLARFLHYLCPKWFSLRQQLSLHTRLMLTFRRESNVERQWRQQLASSLQECNRQYAACRKKGGDYLITIASHEKSIVSQAAIIAKQEETINNQAKQIASREAVIDTLGNTLTKVYQNERQALQELAAAKEEKRLLLLKIASQAEFITYLWTRIPP